MVVPLHAARAFRQAGRPLGIHANTAAKPFATDAKSDIAEAARWQWQRAAQGLLSQFKRTKVSRAGHDVDHFEFRVCNCCRSTSGAQPVLARTKGGTKAWFEGLQTCGSVWTCSICAGRITSERRAVMNQAIAAWKGKGGAAYLLTYTMSHQRSDDLAAVVKDLRTMRSKLTSHRQYKDAMTYAFAGGAVRALEVTHGELNGWHPHTHDIVFAAPGQLATLRAVRKLWVRLLIKHKRAGLESCLTSTERFAQIRYLMRHALTVQDGTYAAEYVAKFGMEPTTEAGGRWGLASELARGHLKQGKRLTGRTPFALLAQYCAGGEDDKERRQAREAGMLFRDYAQVFQGQRQLFWSKGFLKRLGINERDDDAIAADAAEIEPGEERENLGMVSLADWENVLGTNTRHRLLMVARDEGKDGVRRFLASLRGRPHTHRSDYDVQRLWTGYH